MAQHLTGKLLVATPGLSDPNFHRTVLFIGLHDEGGAFGLVLNRPAVAELKEHLPEWEAAASPPALVFRGGPVEPSSIMALALGAAEDDPGWRPLTGGYGLVDLGDHEGARSRRWRELRFFSGYAGWGAGQLDAEMEAGAWWVADVMDGDVFTDDPDGLWRRVVQRDPSTRMYGHAPLDPRAN